MRPRCTERGGEKVTSQSFKFWDAYYDTLKLMDTPEERDEFIMALCAFVFDGTEPEFSHRSSELCFTLTRKSAEASREIADRARENGLKGGRPSKAQQKKGSVNQGRNQHRNQGQKRIEANREEKNREESCLLGYDSSSEASHGAPSIGAPAQPYEDEDGDLVMPDGSRLSPAPPGCG